MNAKLARDLRRLAYNTWVTYNPEIKKVVTVRMVYKDLKKEYRDEKGRCYTATPKRT